ncbi:MULTISPECIES: hypothetical protein [Paenibacillus]|uniref:hypothetical protein n=1 Tax=Paenibacillus TaxID=44249 RepID=UPI0015769363|nr:hypothetical protein [Paenibacillus sp. JMULE4]NTZ18510.1 hypothetical protein [Paenibacillus sp. JMULE4]
MKHKPGGKRSGSAFRQDIPLQRLKQQQLNRESGMKGNEEFAADASPLHLLQFRRERTRTAAASRVEQPDPAASASYRWLGYTALILAVLSLMVLPVLLGSTAALIGFFAFMLGQRTLGAWSVAIGLIALAGYFVLVPLLT